LHKTIGKMQSYILVFDYNDNNLNFRAGAYSP
jgi:hypothetical protein